MPDNYADLLEILTKQSSVVDELIELGLAETDAFKIDDVPRIISIVDRQKEAVDRMCALERRKAELMNGNTPLTRGCSLLPGRSGQEAAEDQRDQPPAGAHVPELYQDDAEGAGNSGQRQLRP